MKIFHLLQAMTGYVYYNVFTSASHVICFSILIVWRLIALENEYYLYGATSLININTNQSPWTSSSGRGYFEFQTWTKNGYVRCKGRVWVCHLRTQRRPITLFIHRAVRNVHPLQTVWHMNENGRKLHSTDWQLLSTSEYHSVCY